MIDDTEHKMREYPRNVLVVPEFNEEALLAHEESPDDVLIRLKVILKQIFQQIENVTQLNGFDFDVRDVLQEHRPAIDTLNRRS